MKTVAIIQARLGSSRLPGKILQDIAGQPMLTRVVNRVQQAKTLDEVIVATTSKAQDDRVAEFCAQSGWHCFRGDEDDVLNRFYQAALAHRAETIVRITSDCPLMDGELIDQVVQEYRKHRSTADYVANIIPQRTFPRGLDIEVFSMDALSRAWQTAQDPAFREHVTLYLYRHPEQFRLQGLLNETDCSGYRWTVDTQEDLTLARRIYSEIGRDLFSWKEALVACQAHPEWATINSHIEQKAA